jgi:hypothetical protein
MSNQLGNMRFYSPEEVATIINRSYGTALRHIKEGLVASEKVNTGYLVPHDELVKYLEEHFALPEDIIELRLYGKAIGRTQSA